MILNSIEKVYETVVAQTAKIVLVEEHLRTGSVFARSALQEEVASWGLGSVTLLRPSVAGTDSDQ
jgi:hypothetical protein